MAGGRPTKYGPEILESAKQYLASYKDHGDVIPSAAGLAVYLRISRATLYNWGEESQEFLDILDDIQAKQENVLINNGLNGEFNAAITKLVLGKHGYSEKQETTHGLTDTLAAMLTNMDGADTGLPNANSK